eukprot:359625-Chlamydomonas_euryale.AAC.1
MEFRKTFAACAHMRRLALHFRCGLDFVPVSVALAWDLPPCTWEDMHCLLHHGPASMHHGGRFPMHLAGHALPTHLVKRPYALQRCVRAHIDPCVCPPRLAC